MLWNFGILMSLLCFTACTKKGFIVSWIDIVKLCLTKVFISNKTQSSLLLLVDHYLAQNTLWTNIYKNSFISLLYKFWLDARLFKWLSYFMFEVLFVRSNISNTPTHSNVIFVAANLFTRNIFLTLENILKVVFASS